MQKCRGFLIFGKTNKKNIMKNQCPLPGTNTGINSCFNDLGNLPQSMPGVKKCDLCENYYHGDGYPVVNENFIVQKGLRSCGCNLDNPLDK